MVGPCFVTNVAQIFSPIALTIAYFSLPTILLPGIPILPVFLLVFLGIAIMVRVLFDVSGNKVDQIWWYRGVKYLVVKFRSPTSSPDEHGLPYPMEVSEKV